MLKDITLGQYFPGDTVVHRLDPRTKLLLVVIYIVALFAASSWITITRTAIVLPAHLCCWITWRRACGPSRSSEHMIFGTDSHESRMIERGNIE